MKPKNYITLLFATMVSACLGYTPSQHKEPTDWSELIEHSQRETILALMEEEQLYACDNRDDMTRLVTQSLGIGFAPINQELVGQAVKLAGFVVPLEQKNGAITEFLLVPYSGACIDSPPPPANQIIHIQYAQGLVNSSADEAVWVEGELNTLPADYNELGEVAFTMSEPSITAYPSI